jgi:hypothetical protein
VAALPSSVLQSAPLVPSDLLEPNSRGLSRAVQVILALAQHHSIPLSNSSPPSMPRDIRSQPSSLVFVTSPHVSVSHSGHSHSSLPPPPRVTFAPSSPPASPSRLQASSPSTSLSTRPYQPNADRRMAESAIDVLSVVEEDSSSEMTSNRRASAGSPVALGGGRRRPSVSGTRPPPSGTRVPFPSSAIDAESSTATARPRHTRCNSELQALPISIPSAGPSNVRPRHESVGEPGTSNEKDRWWWNRSPPSPAAHVQPAVDRKPGKQKIVVKARGREALTYVSGSHF